jgi:hypothetical protein
MLFFSLLKEFRSFFGFGKLTQQAQKPVSIPLALAGSGAFIIDSFERLLINSLDI